ncbi:hypothetical protein K2173_016501 [Erythroxylum novogranatense]|uniref:AB hydrolase-1 domain-containing protein n=1 Tax=Erythroxylum novogranatense TaxID=1862640 RepID=A0AAV8SSZ5_9ROSI|nr:hypothetical protein K2173_016501 [Erythroxylum novogranatense]
MRNLCTCFATKSVKKRKPTKRLAGNQQTTVNSSNRWSRIRSTRKDSTDFLIQEQALAATILFRQHQQQNESGTLLFDRSTSLRYSNSNWSKKTQLPRSSSSRARSLTDPLLQPHQLVNQDIKLDGIETTHFVLVHGGGFGAWCWYKTIALLEESGYRVSAIDLTRSGIHSFDTNGIANLSQYFKPLTNFLGNLADEEKIISYYCGKYSGDFGGACLSYAMELFPTKISKAIFMAAAMLTHGQSAIDIFSQQEGSNDLMRHAPIFLYGKGSGHSPTAIDFDKALIKDLLFNQSPAKDVALASVSMRPIPFAPFLENLCLSDMKYRIVRRFYIGTLEDNAIPLTLQESADHSPFFSKPQALHKLLIEISGIPSTN